MNAPCTPPDACDYARRREDQNARHLGVSRTFRVGPVRHRQTMDRPSPGNADAPPAGGTGGERSCLPPRTAGGRVYARRSTVRATVPAVLWRKTTRSGRRSGSCLALVVQSGLHTVCRSGLADFRRPTDRVLLGFWALRAAQGRAVPSDFRDHGHCRIVHRAGAGGVHDEWVLRPSNQDVLFVILRFWFGDRVRRRANNSA